MTVFMLTHFNGLDYYQKDTTFLGVYSTMEKARQAMEREQAAAAPGYEAKLWDDMTEDEQQFTDLHYQIQEIQVDPEEGQVKQ